MRDPVATAEAIDQIVTSRIAAARMSAA